MPFLEKLLHWASERGGHPAVVVGARTLDYAGLLKTAREVAAGELASQPVSGPHALVSVIDAASGTELASRFCAALLQSRTVMVLDAGWPVELRENLAGRAHTWATHQVRPTGTENPSDGGQPFLLGLSSGTSALPKAFIRSAASWAESFVRSAEFFQVMEGSITLAPGPLAASMNLYALGESIHAGGTLVGLPAFGADAALSAIAEHSVNRLVLVPTILELVARRGLATGRPALGIARIVCAGSALSPATAALARKWAPNAVIQQYYGAAELGLVAASTMAPGTEFNTPGGVGTAFPGVDISIRGTNGAELPAGQPGSVFVRSPYVSGGYAWGDDGLAFATLEDTAWHTVNDQGHLDPDGTLHLAGRAGDMVLSSGANVYPHAVEQALQRGTHADIVVTGIPDTARGHMVVAAFRPALHGGAAQETLAGMRQNAAALPASHRPSRYYLLNELPLTGSGKISRALLAQWIMEGAHHVRRQ